MDPPPSPPVAREAKPATMEAPAPPLDPPDVRSVFQGFLQGSPNLFSLAPSSPNSGEFVLPSIIAPAAKTLSTTAQSASGILSLYAKEPPVVFTPLVICKSFMEIGIPCRAPRSSPLTTACSAFLADAKASSAVTVR